MKNRMLSRSAIITLLAINLIWIAAAVYTYAQRTTQRDQRSVQHDDSLFQVAESAWDNQRWEQAVAGYRMFVQQFPSHPMAAEAQFKIGYYLSYVASPETAIAEYEKVIAMAPGTHEAHESKVGIAALKYWLQDYEAALELFRQVMKETDDWSMFKESAYRLKEMSRLIELKKLPNQRSSMDCGPKALELVFAQHHIPASDKKLEKLLTKSGGGVTLEELKDVAQSAGLKAWGMRLKADQINKIQKPFIAHIGTSHYLVVTKVNSERIEFIDPHRGNTYRTRERFWRFWKGDALVFGERIPPGMHSQMLTKAEMESIRGGHHLHGDNKGDKKENPNSDSEDEPSCNGPGLPRWSVNLSNFNFLVQDTDFSYGGRGPSVEIVRTYNADDPQEGVFGRSWTFNYNVYLSVDPNGNVDIKRGAGKVDHFVARGGGTFDPPLWNYDRLFRNPDGTFRLEIKRTKLTQHFNAQGKLAQITDRNGNSVALQYDATNHLKSVTDAVGRVTQFNYSGDKVSEIVDPIGRKAIFSYDGNNNLVFYIDMAGNQVRYAYDNKSYMTSITTPKGTTQIRNGNTPHFTEVPFVVKEIADPLGNTTHFDTGFGIAWVIDARGNQTFYFNNGNGETTEIQDPLGNKIQRVFTSGNLTKITDANGRSTTLDYDGRGNVTRVIDPLGNKVEFLYDSRDNLIQSVDPLGKAYRYEYDAKDNLTKITDSKDGITGFTYDSFGQLITLTDARQHTTAFRYESAGNLTSVTNPIGGMTSYTYDGVGRLSTLTDPKGNTFSYNYDGIDRLTEILLPDGSSKRYNYECCNLASITDSSGTLRFEYDEANRLARFTNAQNQTIQYGYDPNRNLIALTYPDGKVVRYEYDAVNRLKKVIDWLGNITVYNYDPAGNLVSNTNPNGTLSGFQYDTGNRLTNLINAKSDGSVISSYKYTLDRLGNRTSIATVEPISPSRASSSVNYTYDDDNRITTATEITFTHDANGNLTASSGASLTTYDYDVFNRLSQVSSSGHNAQYQYDGLGHRFTRTVNGITTKYIVDPNGSLSRVLAETDKDGNATAYYVYGLGLISKFTPTGQGYFYHYDGLGNAITMTDLSANIVNKYSYDASGKILNSVEATPNPFKYAGQDGIMDEGDGLLYMRLRYYDTEVGRFINKDPIGFLGGLNLYAYVGNNPVNASDPSGLGPIGASVSPLTVAIGASANPGPIPGGVIPGPGTIPRRTPPYEPPSNPTPPLGDSYCQALEYQITKIESKLGSSCSSSNRQELLQELGRAIAQYVQLNCAPRPRPPAKH